MRSVVEWLEPLEVRELVRLWWRGFTLEMAFLIPDITSGMLRFGASGNI